MSIKSRLVRLEQSLGGGRLIVAKLGEGDNLEALLERNGITERPSDLIVRINRPDGCGEDFARVVA